MSPGMVAAWVVGLLTFLVVGVTIAALWPEPRPGRRRAGRVETPRALVLAVEDPTGDEHDWDGFLRALDPRPTMREQQIEMPRDGEPL